MPHHDATYAKVSFRGQPFTGRLLLFSRLIEVGSVDSGSWRPTEHWGVALLDSREIKPHCRRPKGRKYPKRFILHASQPSRNLI